MLTTLTDRKLHRDFNLNDTADFYCSDTTSFHDYYPYGMEKPGRGSNPTGYRFGFNGVEADNALMPGRTGYHTYFRQYDTRTARWFSVDPVVHPWQSPYNAMDGNPIYFADPGGANTIAREEDPDIFDTETAGTDPASVPTGGESFKFENTIGFDPLAGIKNNISNPSTVNPPMQDNSTAAQNSYSFENNMQAEGGGEKANSGGGLGEAAPNSAFTLRGNDVNYKTLYNEFLTGSGPEYSLFTEGHPMVEDLKKSWILGIAAAEFLAGGGERLEMFDVPFGLVGAGMSRTMTEQFIGGARISIIPAGAGNIIIVNNTTGRYSYRLHSATDIPRVPETLTPEGTTYQRFIWYQE